MWIDMERINPEINMDRFYCVQLTCGLFSDAGVERIWGRRGTKGRHRLDWYESKSDAAAALIKLIKAKEKKGYELISSRSMLEELSPETGCDHIEE